MPPIRNQAKANAARLRAAAASLDPRIRISLADGKETHEWRAAGQLPSRSGSGVRTEVAEHLVRVLGELQEELGAPQGRPATPRRRRRRRRRRRA